MRKIAGYMISLIMLICCLCCDSNIKSNKVIKVLQYSVPYDGQMVSYLQKDGDFDLGWGSVIRVEWNKNGVSVSCDKNLCVAYDEAADQIMNKSEYLLSDGEQLQLIVHATPNSVYYRLLLCNDDDPLPEEWVARLANLERIKKKQEQYGSYEAFAATRNQEVEKAQIEQAKTNAGWTETMTERCYDTFLRSLWVNGDTDVTIKAVSTRVDVHNEPHQYEFRFICLICDDGNTYDVAADYFVLRNGMQYYGPTE
ncbi:MAG: hypothetical protein II049_08975 [Clostridia bacterium]|nr:hypothetical protein [Clostridia bacterium]